MKAIKTTTFLLLGIIFLSSCEKVIDIDLNEQDSQIVIEAELEYGSSSFEVMISRTRPYFAAGQTETISDADVRLIDASGVETNLTLISNGRYTAPYNAQIGETYTLKVLVDGTTYTAQSTMPDALPMNGLVSEYQPAFGPFTEGYAVYVNFNDPAGVENYFRIKHSWNGIEQTEGSDLTVDNDQLSDGSLSLYPLAAQKSFNIGDTINVRFIQIDETTYDYFSSLQDITGGGTGPAAPAAPGNPVTNWDNNALGYFSAQNPDEAMIVIQ
ncbi:MAG: DUF4249 domain-containing protein [Crocinitomicaceae bacterium]